MKLTKRGFGFGLTSGVITTLGILTGLYVGTHSKSIVLLGLISVIIADAFSDAFGIHISEESSTKNNSKIIWKETYSTFVSKLIFGSVFLIPILLFNLDLAIIINLILGAFILCIFSYIIAKKRKDNVWKTIFEHLMIGAIVVLITYFIGKFISTI